MKRLAQWSAIVALTGVYLATLYAVLHPKISSAYRSYYIDRTTSDWNPEHYPSTPEQGISFSRKGLPDWVSSTYGLSSRDYRGRWTDGDLSRAPGLAFTRTFTGTFCVEFTASPASALVGKTVAVQLGDKTKMLQVVPQDVAEYKAQFTDLRGADRLSFLLPDKLPRESEVDHRSADTRRLGLELTTLRIIPGSCPGPQAQSGISP